MTGILTKRLLCLTAAMLLMISLLLAVFPVSSHAYFTSYTPSYGGWTLYDRTEIEIHEQVKNMEKSVSVENTGDVPCWVRTLLVAPVGYTLSVSGSDWVERGGFWYYTQPLPVGASTPAPDSGSSLKVGITVPDVGRDELQREFNVVVLSECVPVTYNENGKPDPATWDQVDWNMKENGSEEAG